MLSGPFGCSELKPSSSSLLGFPSSRTTLSPAGSHLAATLTSFAFFNKENTDHEVKSLMHLLSFQEEPLCSLPALLFRKVDLPLQA